MIIGINVQIISINLPCLMNRFENKFLIKVSIIWITRIVIKIISIVTMSWRNIRRSRIGELEFCIENNHVLIFNKKILNFIYGV